MRITISIFYHIQVSLCNARSYHMLLTFNTDVVGDMWYPIVCNTIYPWPCRADVPVEFEVSALTEITIST